MRSALLVAALATVLAAPAISAHADTISTFELSGQYQNQYRPNQPIYSASGTITVDTTTGLVQNIDLTYEGLQLSSKYGFLDSFVEYSTPATGWTVIHEEWASIPLVEAVSGLAIFIPDASLVGYSGGPICSMANPCFNGSPGAPTYSAWEFGPGQGSPFLNGDLTLLSAPTPEPSSLALLGTGMLSLLGFGRRKLLTRT